MLIVGIAQQGLWSSTGGTDQWSKLGGGVGSAAITNRGSTIIFDPTNPATFWESGTHNGGGVYRTDDGGATFRQLGDITHIQGLSVDLSDPARTTLLATVQEGMSTFRSTDGGETWTDISSALPPDIGYALEPVVIDSTTFLLGTGHGTGSKLLRTTNAGASWTTAYDAAIAGRSLLAKSDGSMYWLLERVNGVITSQNNGHTWTLIPPASEVLPTSLGLLELQGGSLASVSNDRVIVSNDHGASWARVGPPMPIVPNGMVYSPFRKAFYIWKSDCDSATADPIRANSIMRLDFDPIAQ